MNEYGKHLETIEYNLEKQCIRCHFCEKYIEVFKLDNYDLKTSDKVCRNCQSNKNIEYNFLLEQEKKHEIFNRVILPNKPLTSKEVESAVNIGELKMIRDYLNKEFSIDFIPEWLAEKEIVINKNKLSIKKESIGVLIILSISIIISMCLIGIKYPYIGILLFTVFLFVVGFLNYRFNDFNDNDFCG